MADSVVLECDVRTEFGKGASRRIRRDGKIPAVVYGHGEAPLHISLPGHAAFQALKVQNALLTLKIEGEEKMVLAKDVQRDPIKPVIEHVDLVIVRRGEKVTVDVPLTTEGETAGETVVTVVHGTISVEAEATHIPEQFVVSLEGKEAGTLIHASEIALPNGVTLLIDPEEVVVNIAEPISEEALEAELAEAEAEAGIEKDEADEETEGEGDDAEGAEGDSEGGDDAEGEKGDGDDE